MAERERTGLRGFIPPLPRAAWLILGGDCLSAIGNGLVLPFFIIYLNKVRGFDIDIAAYALSTMSLVGLVVGPLGGWLTDRFGARRIVILSLVISAMGSVSIAQVRETWHAFAAAALFGVGITLFWPAVHSFLTMIVERHQRSAAFSVHYAAINLGIGIGGILGGFMVNVSDPSTFEFVYYMDALSFVPFILILLFTVKNVMPVLERDPDAAADVRAPGYLTVLKDTRFLRILLLMTLLVTVGYGQLESAFPAYATRPGGISERALGATFAANTFFIVIFQLIVLRYLDGRRRTRAIMFLTAVWAACWAVVMFGGTLGSGLDATLAFSFAAVLFAFGETVISPTLSPMVQDLATDRTRGRYSAVFALTWMAGSVLGPALAGFLLDAGRPTVLFSLLIAGCAVAAGLARNLERHIPAEANLVQLQEEEAVTEPEAVGAEA